MYYNHSPYGKCSNTNIRPTIPDRKWKDYKSERNWPKQNAVHHFCKRDIEWKYRITNTGEITTTSKGSNLAVDQGQGIIATKDNSETANYTLIGAENFTQAGKTVFQGAVVYSTNSTGNLSFLDNIVGIFKGEGDITTGNFTSTEWEWK